MGALQFQSLRDLHLSERERSENMKVWIMQIIDIHMLHCVVERMNVPELKKKKMDKDENLI